MRICRRPNLDLVTTCFEVKQSKFFAGLENESEFVSIWAQEFREAFGASKSASAALHCNRSLWQSHLRQVGQGY